MTMPSRKEVYAQKSQRPSVNKDGPSRTASLGSNTSINLDAFRARIKVRVQRGQLAMQIWQIMEEAESSLAARFYSRFLPAFVMLNIVFCLMTWEESSLSFCKTLAIAHLTFDVFFALEVTIRFVVCPNRFAFFSDTHNMIDVVAGLPLILSIFRLAAGPDSAANQAIFHMTMMTPCFRLLKVLRTFEKFHLLREAFWIALEALPVLLYTLSIILIFFSVLLYFAECGMGDVSTLPEAMWLTIVTMTTVGYGDVVPRTTLGHITISVLTILSALYMAVPIGIVGGAFSRVWEDRDRLLMITRTRHKLVANGWGPRDILELFYRYDIDRSGELNFGEFSLMINDMQLGLSEDRVVNLFKTFDSDGSGQVDDEEFVRALYPKAYNMIYQDGRGRHSMTDST